MLHQSASVLPLLHGRAGELSGTVIAVITAASFNSLMGALLFEIRRQDPVLFLVYGSGREVKFQEFLHSPSNHSSPHIADNKSSWESC